MASTSEVWPEPRQESTWCRRRRTLCSHVTKDPQDPLPYTWLLLSTTTCVVLWLAMSEACLVFFGANEFAHCPLVETDGAAETVPWLSIQSHTYQCGPASTLSSPQRRTLAPRSLFLLFTKLSETEVDVRASTSDIIYSYRSCALQAALSTGQRYLSLNTHASRFRVLTWLLGPARLPGHQTPTRTLAGDPTGVQPAGLSISSPYRLTEAGGRRESSHKLEPFARSDAIGHQCNTSVTYDQSVLFPPSVTSPGGSCAAKRLRPLAATEAGPGVTAG